MVCSCLDTIGMSSGCQESVQQFVTINEPKDQTGYHNHKLGRPKMVPSAWYLGILVGGDVFWLSG